MLILVPFNTFRRNEKMKSDGLNTDLFDSINKNSDRNLSKKRIERRLYESRMQMIQEYKEWEVEQLRRSIKEKFKQVLLYGVSMAIAVSIMIAIFYLVIVTF